MRTRIATKFEWAKALPAPSPEVTLAAKGEGTARKVSGFANLHATGFIHEDPRPEGAFKVGFSPALPSVLGGKVCGFPGRSSWNGSIPVVKDKPGDPASSLP